MQNEANALNKVRLANKLREELGITKGDATLIVELIVNELIEHVRRGEPILIRGLIKSIVYEANSCQRLGIPRHKKYAIKLNRDLQRDADQAVGLEQNTHKLTHRKRRHRDLYLYHPRKGHQAQPAQARPHRRKAEGQSAQKRHQEVHQ